jgi:hypothetical protein
MVGGAFLYFWPSAGAPRTVSFGVVPAQGGGFVSAGARF